MANHGLTPGGVGLRTGKQAVFFTAVNPMDNQDGSGETQCDLAQARIASNKNTWKRFQNTVFRCNLKLAHQRELQFFIKQDQTQFFFTTHCLQSSLRKRFAIRPRIVRRSKEIEI